MANRIKKNLREIWKLAVAIVAIGIICFMIARTSPQKEKVPYRTFRESIEAY